MAFLLVAELNLLVMSFIVIVLKEILVGPFLEAFAVNIYVPILSIAFEFVYHQPSPFLSVADSHEILAADIGC